MISKRYISSQAPKLPVSLLDRVTVAANKPDVLDRSRIKMRLPESVDAS